MRGFVGALKEEHFKGRVRRADLVFEMHFGESGELEQEERLVDAVLQRVERDLTRRR